MKRFLLPAKILLSSILIYWALKQIGVVNIVNEIRSAEIHWLLLAILLFLGSHLQGSRQWQVLLSGEGVKLRWLKVLEYYFVGLFFNNFLVSSMGGDVFRMVDIHRASGQRAAAVSTVFLDRFAGLFVMFSLAILSWPWLMAQQAAGPRLRLFMLLLVLGWLAAIFILFSRRVARPLAWVMNRVLPHRFTQPMKEIYGQIHDFGRRPALLGRVLLIAVTVQGARVMTHFLLAKAMGVSLNPFAFFVIIPIIALSASLPISLGGLGVREGLGVILFGKFGMAGETAYSVEFLAYLVAIFTALPGGVVFMFRKRQTQDAARIQPKES